MTDSLEAMAFNTKLDVNDIYSCRFVYNSIHVSIYVLNQRYGIAVGTIRMGPSYANLVLIILRSESLIIILVLNQVFWTIHRFFLWCNVSD